MAASSGEGPDLAAPLVDLYVLIGSGEVLEPVAGDSVADGTWLAQHYQPSIITEFAAAAVAPLVSRAALSAFCLPSGVRITQEDGSPSAPRFACFVLTQADGTRVYGHCLTVSEELLPTTRVRLAVVDGDVAAAGEGEEPGRQAEAAPTVEELAGGARCYAPRCLCLLSRAHHPLALRACLMTIHQMAMGSASEGGGAPLQLAVETCLSHLVLNVPLPVPGGPTVRFALGNGTAPLHVGCAPPTQLPCTDYSVCVLLTALNAHTLARLFHAALLEQQIVVICDDDELRLATCELLLLLLHPLHWAQVYVPTIPDELLGLLANPFPCILGLTTRQAPQLPSPLPETMAILTLRTEHPPPPAPPPLATANDGRSAAGSGGGGTAVVGGAAAAADAGDGGGGVSGGGGGDGGGGGSAAALHTPPANDAAARFPAAATATGADFTAPRGPLPPLPPREAGHLLSSLLAAHEAARHAPSDSICLPTAHSESQDIAEAAPIESVVLEPPMFGGGGGGGGGDSSLRAGEVRAGDTGGGAKALHTPAALEARTRGAFLRFLVSMLRDLHRHFPEAQPDGSRNGAGSANAEGVGALQGGATAGDSPGGADAADREESPPAATDDTAAAPSAAMTPDWGRLSDEFDAQLAAFLAAQPASSLPFLAEFTRTQMFLSFVQPSAPPVGGRGGRCFQMVRDAFLQRELSDAANRERLHSGAPLPASAQLVLLASAAPTAPLPPPETSSPRHAVFDVAAPSMEHGAPRAAGYTYAGGRLPTQLDEALLAAHRPVPAFDGELPPPPRVSAAVRAAWSDALAELERRREQRMGAQVAAGVGSSLIIGGAAAAMLGCVVQ